MILGSILITVVIALIVAALIIYVVDNLPLVEPPFRNVLKVLVILILIIYLLSLIGVRIP